MTEPRDAEAMGDAPEDLTGTPEPEITQPQNGPATPPEATAYSGPQPPPVPHLPPDAFRPQPPPLPAEPGGRDVLKVILLVLMIQLFTSFVLGMILAFTGLFDGKDAAALPPVTMPVLALIFEVALVFLTYYYACRKYGRSFVDGLNLQRPEKRQAVRAATFGFALAVVWGFISIVRSGLNPELMADAPLTRILSSFAGMIAFMIVALAAPPAEEIFFRGFMLPVLARKYRAIPALIVTTAAFTLMHGHQLGWDVVSLLMIAAIGLILGVQRLRTGSTALCILTHWFYNLVLVLLTAVVALFAAGDLAP